MVERTAKHAFTLDERPVAKGQIVTLNPLQLDRLVKAGCVAETDEENELVEQAELPALRFEDENEKIQGQLADVRRQAGEELDKLRKGVNDARLAAEEEIRSHQDRVATAKSEADAAVKTHEARVAEAKEAADRAVKEHEDRAAKAKEAADKAGK
ncbi:hypothetical protein [Methylobacterium gnaphalii]|nr:hypothetical protein [Methylobacterium gnaphalii]